MLRAPGAPSEIRRPLVRQPTQARAKVKVRAILDAADQLLRSLSSVEELVMRDVARRAGVKPATLYDYFPTKELLLRALEDRAWRSAADRVRLLIETQRSRSREVPLADAIADIVAMFMTEMSDAARRYGLTPESPFGAGPREIIGAELATLATTALEGRTGLAGVMREADLHLRLRIATETVALLTWVGARDHAAALEDGSYPREVGRLIAHYLVRDSEQAA